MLSQKNMSCFSEIPHGNTMTWYETPVSYIFPMKKSPKPSSGLPGDRRRRCEEGDRGRRRVGHSEASRHRRQRRGAGALCHVGHLHDQHFASAMATWLNWWVKHHVKAMGIHLAEMLDLSILAISCPYSRAEHIPCQNSWEISGNCEDPFQVKFVFHTVCQVLLFFWHVRCRLHMFFPKEDPYFQQFLEMS